MAKLYPQTRCRIEHFLISKWCQAHKEKETVLEIKCLLAVNEMRIARHLTTAFMNLKTSVVSKTDIDHFGSLFSFLLTFHVLLET